MINNIINVVFGILEEHPGIILAICAVFWFRGEHESSEHSFRLLLIGLGGCLAFGGGYFLLHLNDIIIFENISSFEDIFTVLKIAGAALAAAGAGVLLIVAVIRKSRT